MTYTQTLERKRGSITPAPTVKDRSILCRTRIIEDWTQSIGRYRDHSQEDGVYERPAEVPAQTGPRERSHGEHRALDQAAVSAVDEPGERAAHVPLDVAPVERPVDGVRDVPLHHQPQHAVDEPGERAAHVPLDVVPVDGAQDVPLHHLAQHAHVAPGLVPEYEPVDVLELAGDRVHPHRRQDPRQGLGLCPHHTTI